MIEFSFMRRLIEQIAWPISLIISVTATANAIAPSIDVGSAVPDASNKATVTVSLSRNGNAVGGVQNTIVFDNTILTLGNADCKINPAIGLSPKGPSGKQCSDDTTIGPCKNLSKIIKPCGAKPEPLGCPAGAGANLSVVNTILAATAAPNANPIPDGALYTCTFKVIKPAALPTTLQNLKVVVSDPTGHQLCSGTGTPCSGANGKVGAASARRQPARRRH